jgi:hypothetical protein
MPTHFFENHRSRVELLEALHRFPPLIGIGILLQQAGLTKQNERAGGISTTSRTKLQHRSLLDRTALATYANKE